MKLSTFLVAIPVVTLAGVIAVANRSRVTFSLDPFSRSDPSLQFELPLFMVVFLALLLGVVLGGFAVWWSRTPPAQRSRSRTVALNE